MAQKEANSSEAGWALIMEGVASSRVEAHRLQKLLAKAKQLVDQSPHREHVYQVAGDLIMSVPAVVERLERILDRTSYALAIIGEEHLKDRLPLHDRAKVEDGVENSLPWSSRGRSKASIDSLLERHQARKAARGK